MDENINTILEEEIKNRLRDDFFKDYDASPIIGKIDFAVTLKTEGEELFDKEYFLWAEAKRSPKEELVDSFIQLVITIGKAKTHEKLLPPHYLGAFDKEKIAFIEFHNIIGALYQGEINWNVAPSDHKTDTFIQLRRMLNDILMQGMTVFNIKKDEKALRKFISKNFRLGKDRISRINITRNNFMFVFQRWVEEVKPSIAVEWADVPKTSVVDFFYADLISRDDFTRSEDLAVVLRGDRYKILQQILKSGTQLFSEAFFNDKKVAYKQFWNKYERPPRKDYLGVILERRDLLIPHNLRQYTGAFFTPPQWVQKSQEYLAKELGENWQQEYYIWDCCAGTGNLLYGLTEEYRVWASDLSSGFVQVMKERIKEQSLNLLDSHVFKFDFLNDPISNLPESLQRVLDNPEERKKLVVYINPPYAEAADQKTVANTGMNKKDVAVSTVMYKRYAPNIGIAGRELFAQFLARISHELKGVIIGNFGTLKILQGPSFAKFRDFFHAKLCNMFTVPAYTFDNVNGKFPIGFFIWDTSQKEVFHECESLLFETGEVSCGKRNYLSPDNKKTINDWIKNSRDRDNAIKIGFMSAKGCDFQNQDYNYIISDKSLLPHPRGSWVEDTNLLEICVYFAVRHVIQQDWQNNQDQFFAPLNNQIDDEFVKNCLVYTLFSEKNIIQSQHGPNKWIPFNEKEVGAKDVFASHFMNDYITGKKRPKIIKKEEGELFQGNQKGVLCLKDVPLSFSQEAKSVLDAGKELWIYYHQQPNADPNASYYDIRAYFQGFTADKKGKLKMNSESQDKKYTVLLADLREKMKVLEQQIVPKVYEYGFLLNNNERLPENYHWEAEDQQDVEPAIEVTGNEPYITEAKQLLKVNKKKKSVVPSLAQVLKPVSGAANVNITVNINKFEKNVGAVIQTGGTQNINELIDIKKE
jgi:hypothetical protein